MKNPNVSIRNRNRDLAACRSVSKQTAAMRTPKQYVYYTEICKYICYFKGTDNLIIVINDRIQKCGRFIFNNGPEEI